MEKWKVLESRIVFNDVWFKVRQDKVELPNGKVFENYLLWQAGDVVMIVPVTPNNEFVLIRQYRHAAGEIVIGFPGGLVDAGESPYAAARRELGEETGYSAGNMELLANTFNNPSKVTGTGLVYVATNVVQNQAQHFDEMEEIEVLVKPYREVLDMIYSGEIKTSSTIAATFLAIHKLGLPL